MKNEYYALTSCGDVSDYRSGEEYRYRYVDHRTFVPAENGKQPYEETAGADEFRVRIIWKNFYP